MECAKCKSKNVPQNKEGEYLKECYLPFWIGDRPDAKSDELLDTTNLHRIKMRFPAEVPFCKSCRKKLILEGFDE